MPSAAASTTITRLAPADWQRRVESHRTRAEQHTLPARKRRDHGHPHPVHDFLFQYYPFPFALLENWQPGTGILLERDPVSPSFPATLAGKYHAQDEYGLRLDPSLLGEKERSRLDWIRSLLEATATRPPVFSCHGLHEWAMVYRGKEVRHEKTTRLRLPQADIDAIVESRPLCCTHHDAFRFFAAEARPMNRLQPSLDSRIQLEQPGCVHANMDLYKWAAKAMPWTGSDLLLDCFELALELRELDMRASPYDLSTWGYDPVMIETPEGRKTYEATQRHLSAKAAPLRQRLIATLSLVTSPSRLL